MDTLETNNELKFVPRDFNNKDEYIADISNFIESKLPRYKGRTLCETMREKNFHATTDKFFNWCTISMAMNNDINAKEFTKAKYNFLVLPSSPDGGYSCTMNIRININVHDFNDLKNSVINVLMNVLEEIYKEMCEKVISLNKNHYTMDDFIIHCIPTNLIK